MEVSRISLSFIYFSKRLVQELGGFIVEEHSSVFPHGVDVTAIFHHERVFLLQILNTVHILEGTG